MSFPIPDGAKRAWEEWNVRCAVLISLFLQMFLTVLAKSRKRRGNILLMALIWSSYLIADWIAAFSVGLISSAQSNDCPQSTALNKQLAAFWAPFLLLHLGGPDSITAFSLEDNQLWIRHLLGLVIQLVAVIYVFLQSLDNEYSIPIVLVLFAGTCKYVERTFALYLACLSNFKTAILPKPDPGPNYAQLMEEYSVLEASQVPVRIDIVGEPASQNDKLDDDDGEIDKLDDLDDLDVVLKGYNFFDTFKGLIVDHMFSFRERNQSRMFFFKIRAVDAFKVMEVELNFMYDALYTKMPVVHCKLGYFSRLLCTILIVVCFHQFATHPQHNIIPFDKIVSYILLGGALVLDMVGMFNLVFSDWAIISVKINVSALLIRLRFWKRNRRWSNTMSQHSFISFCLNERSRYWIKKTAEFLRIKDTVDEFQCKKTIICEDELKQFIFKELKAKAKKAETRKKAKEIYSARGEWVLSKHYSDYLMYPSISSSLSEEAEYDESLLLWHIATELCYFTSSCEDQNRNASKVLSDYMLYLLVMRPTLMSTVAGIAQIRFQDTCKEFSKFFERWQSEPALDSKSACEELLKVKTVVKPKDVKGDRSKSLLFDACMLAKDLNKLNEGRKWEIMSRVWVELVSYAASRCRATDHARQLSQGGELITFVWLQMVHFGLGEQFRIEAGHARAKLLMRK